MPAAPNRIYSTNASRMRIGERCCQATRRAHFVSPRTDPLRNVYQYGRVASAPTMNPTYTRDTRIALSDVTRRT
jgi:hypothetical protein